MLPWAPAQNPWLGRRAAAAPVFLVPGLAQAGEVAAAALAVYVALIGAGRLLKRWQDLRLGAVYQGFSLALAAYAALGWHAPAWPGRREFGAASVLLGAAALARPLDQLFWRRYFERRHRVVVPKFVREVSAALLLMVAGLLVVTVGYGVSVPGLLAGSSILAIVLGLAVQDTLGNVVAGLALQLSRPFEVGDWLLMDGQHVQATEVNWRSSRFRSNDGVQWDVPNVQLVRAHLVNFHGSPDRVHAVRLEVGVDSDAPPNRVKEILLRAAASAEHVRAEPPPSVLLKAFGDSALIYEIRFWLDDHRFHLAAGDAVRTHVWYALRRARLRIPYPVHTLQIEPAPGGPLFGGPSGPVPLAAAPGPGPAVHPPGGDPPGGDPPRPPPGGEPARAEGRRPVAALLKAQPLFAELADGHLELIVEKSACHPYGRGEPIIREGDTDTSMFVLLRGEAAVTVRVGDTVTRVASLHRGDCFGEMSLLTGEPRRASVRAQRDCEVLEITKPVFGEVIQADPSLLPLLSGLLARRQLETEGIIVQETHAQDAAQRGLASQKEREYRAGFLHRLRAIFEL